MKNEKEKRATFTPGPWHAWCCKENETGGGIFQDANTESQRMICRMSKEKRVIHKDKRKSDDFVHSGEDEANARLIAAAPELHAQAKVLERLLTTLAMQGETGTDEALDEVREVLAKVDGGEG